ncbi:MAG: DUF4394 domain-containing protein [Ilumatobacteraceae bacterium]
MRSSSTWRPAPTSGRTRRAVAPVLGLVLLVALLACSDDDDPGATTGPAAGADSTSGSAASGAPASGAPVTEPPTAGSPALTQPVAPAFDDTAEVGGSHLFTVDLTTGAATDAGRIGDEVGVLGVTFVPGDAATLHGLTDVPSLVTFSIDDPSTIESSVPITGVAAGSTLLALDATSDGTLLAISDASVLYSIDPATGAATAVGTGLSEPIDDPGFGFDADPATGLLRVGVATGHDVTIDATTGNLVDVGEGLRYAEGDAGAGSEPRIVALAFALDGSDRLYAVDAAAGALVTLDDPDDGALTTIGPLGVTLTDGASFDISSSGTAVLANPG